MNTIRRPHLIQRLSPPRRLTLLSAPPGSGKSTLLREWLDGKKPAWLTLHSSDNDLVGFWHSVISVLNQREQFLPLLHTTLPSTPEVVIVALMNTVREQTDPVFLVLEDYEGITRPEIDRSMALLLEHMPENMHLVIASRRDVRLPVARLRTYHQLVELRAADLNFTLEETAQFLKNVMNLPLNRQDIEALHNVTEGWIAGVQLAALALQGQVDIDSAITAFKGNHRFVVDYLSEEIFQNQSPEMQSFLLQTSILDELNGSLCNAVTGKNSTQEILETLEAANLLLIPLDSNRQQYRYHCLLTDFLRDRLHRTSPEQVSELHYRAAAWYEQHSCVDEAITHALQADTDYAVRLIKNHARAKIYRGELINLKFWLETLPDDVIPGDIDLCLIYGWAMAHSGQIDRANFYLEAVGRCSSDTPYLAGECAAISTRLAALTGDRQNLTVYGHQALRDLPSDALSLRADILLDMGHAYFDTGDVTQARQIFTEAQNLSNVTGNLRVGVFAGYFLAIIKRAQSRLHQAMQQYRQTLTQYPAQLPITGIVHMGMAEIFYEWNDLEQATSHLEKALELAEHGGEAKVMIYANILMAWILQGEEGLKRLEKTVPLVNWMSVSAWQTRLWLAQGKTHVAGYWLSDVEHDIERYGGEFERFTKARVLIALRRLQEAAEFLSALRQNAETYGRNGSLIEILMLQALLYQTANQQTEALETLKQALALAEPEGYLRLFLDEGRSMQQLLAQLDNPYAAKLLSIAGNSSSMEAVETLSEREREVLAFVAAGHSNRAIAESLFLTEGTVKWYLHNIYGKLNVQNRTQAVARAKALHYLN